MNISECISIQSQPVLFDVSSLISVVSIDIQQQLDYKESCIAQIKGTLNNPDDIPASTSMNQPFTSQPIKDAKWILPPVVQEQTIQPSSHVKEDKWKDYDIVKVPAVIDSPKLRLDSMMNQANCNDSDSMRGSICSDMESFDSILNEQENRQVVKLDNEEYSDQDSIDNELSDSDVPHSQLNPPVIPPQLNPPILPPHFNDSSFLEIDNENESITSQENQHVTSFSPSQPVMTTQPVSLPTNEQEDSDYSYSSDGSYWNTLLVDSNKRYGISSSDEDEDEDEENSNSTNENEDKDKESYTSTNENENEENSSSSESQQEFLILPTKENIDTVFNQSQTPQVSKKEQPIILQPLSENEQEIEEISGSRIEQEVSQVEDPQIDHSIKGSIRRIPYHGDEDEDIKRSITYSALDISLQHIVQLLQKEETGIYGNQIKSNDDRIENEEIPGDIRYQEYYNDIDMGNEK